MRVVALLRGVNVGGVRFAMKDLTAALEAAGSTGVRTVLASGNVLLDDGGRTAEQVSAEVRRVIADAFGFDVAVLVVPLSAVRAAVEGWPFARAADRHAYAVFGSDPAAIAELAAEAAALDPAVESVAAGAGVLFWTVPKGSTLDSAFGKRLGRRVAAGTVTTRNLQTLEKVLAAS